MNIVVSQKNSIGREQDFDEYSFEVDLDGQFELGVWLVSELPRGPIQVRISLRRRRDASRTGVASGGAVLDEPYRIIGFCEQPLLALVGAN